ncbi:MAG: ABC transporter permease [Anaerolineae bacterium]|nr:ABC transporter permease [Anaerolineae bacterium]
MATETFATRESPGQRTITRDDIAAWTLPELTGLRKLLGPEWYRLLRGLVTNPLSVAGSIIVTVFILIAVFAPVLAPPIRATADPYLIPRDGYGPEPKPPGTEWKKDVPPVPFWYPTLTGKDGWVHLMGTTAGQFDIWYGVVWGSRTALFAGIVVTFSTVLVGIIVGSISAFYGGWLDDVLQRITEIFMAFPFLLAALMLAAILVPKFGRSIWPPTIALIVFGWTRYARVVRGDILSAKERDYIMAARVIGAKDNRLIIRHILPNVIYPILVLASFRLGDAVLSFAALSFLGVGTDIGYADWGQIISFARDWILSLDTHWYIILFPGAALIIFGLGWNLIGDAMRDILDPRLRTVRG